MDINIHSYTVTYLLKYGVPDGISNFLLLSIIDYDYNENGGNLNYYKFKIAPQLQAGDRENIAT